MVARRSWTIFIWSVEEKFIFQIIIFDGSLNKGFVSFDFIFLFYVFFSF